jgi:histone H3/H4
MATEKASIAMQVADDEAEENDKTSSSASSSEGESSGSDSDDDDDSNEVEQVLSWSADGPPPPAAEAGAADSPPSLHAEDGRDYISVAVEKAAAASDVKAAAVVLAAVRRGAPRLQRGATDVRQNKRHANKPKRKRVVTEMAIRRLARRAGVTRMSMTVFEETRATVAATLRSLVQDAVVYAENGRRKTVTVLNVTCATKRQGHPIYGF